MSIRNWTLAVAAILPWLAAGCGSATGPGSSGPSLSLSIAVTSGTPTASVVGAPAFDLVLGDGGSTLTITRVAVVVREIELERLNDDDCDLLAESADECEKFETGPMVFEVPMDGSVTHAVAIDAVPADVYDELEFDIHKLDSQDAEDALVVQQNPELDGMSIRVEGDFDGTSFVYETDLNEEQEMALSPPLEITEDMTDLNVTLTLDVDRWFRGAAGSLVDPATANKDGVNENLVRDNIKSSIDVFEDNDRDGESDS